MNEPRKINLADGLDADQQAELGDLRRLEERLRRFDAPDPTPEEQSAVLATLASLLAGHAAIPADGESEAPQGIEHWLRLIRAQAGLIGLPFWAASSLIFAVGMALGFIGDGSLLAILFVLCAPVLAAVGVSYVFRPETRTLRELEQISPVGTLELLYARLTLVLAFNTFLCLIVLGVIWLHGPQVALWRLFITWLGPMLALSGTALYVSVRWGAPAGVAVPLGIWGMLMLLGWREAAAQGAPLIGGWLLAQIGQSDLLLVVSMAALLIGVALFRQTGRFLSRETAAWN